MSQKKELSSKFWIIILVTCSLFVILIALGFASFGNEKKPVVENKENGGNVYLNYVGDVAGLKVKDLSPLADSVGIKKDKEGQYFDFSVDVSLDNAAFIDYEISVVKDEKFSTISDDDIKIYLEKENSGIYEEVFGPEKFTPLSKTSKVGTPVGSMGLYKNRSTRVSTDRYRLRIWMSDKSATAKGNYGVDIFVNASAK